MLPNSWGQYQPCASQPVRPLGATDRGGWERTGSTFERVPQAPMVHKIDVPTLWTIDETSSIASDW